MGMVCTCKGYFILSDDILKHIPSESIPGKDIFAAYLWKALKSKTVSKTFSMHALKI